MLSTRSITALSAIAAALLAAGCATTTGDIEDLPRPKSGHWQISSTDQDGQTVQFQDCMDKDTFYKTRELQKAKYEVQQCQTGSRKDSNPLRMLHRNGSVRLRGILRDCECWNQCPITQISLNRRQTYALKWAIHIIRYLLIWFRNILALLRKEGLLIR